MRFVWIGGWAIAPGEIEEAARRRWPEAEHAAIAPGPAWREHAAQLIQPGDRVAGYSLGAFLLLRSPPSLVPMNQVMLLAPILDLRLEQAIGGRVQELRLRYMLRQLARKPRETIADFYRSAALALTPPAGLPYPLADLAWGLEQLHRPAGKSRPEMFQDAIAVAGDRDPLVDADRLAEHLPGLRILPGVGHDFTPLLDGTP